MSTEPEPPIADPNAPLTPEPVEPTSPEPVDPPPSGLPPVVAEWGALPFAVKVVAVFVFVGVLVWGWNAAGGAVEHWRDNRTDSKLADTEKQLDAKQAENERLKGAVDELQRQVAAKDEELRQLKEQGRRQDADVETNRKRVGAARAGRSDRPIRNRDELDKRLRAIYPEAQ